MIGVEFAPESGLPFTKKRLWTEIDGTIGALGSSVVIDSLPLSEFDNMKYVMTFKGATQDDIRYLEMSVQQRDGSIVEVVSGKTGPLKMALDTNINGSSFELLATNPENFSVDYVLTVLTI